MISAIKQVQEKITQKIEEQKFISSQKICEDINQSHDEFFLQQMKKKSE